jgi:hypothetical protein
LGGSRTSGTSPRAMTRSPESYSSRSALLQSLPLGSEFFESDCPIQGPACLRRAEGSDGFVHPDHRDRESEDEDRTGEPRLQYQTPAVPAAHRGGMIDNCLIAFVRGFNIANTAPVVHVRQNPARKPIKTAQPRNMVTLIEASSLPGAGRGRW